MSQAPDHCEICGELMFFNHRQWSSGGDLPSGGIHSHGDCERAALARAALPIAYDHSIEALVEITESLGRFVSESDDEEWADPARLQKLLLDAYAKASDGYRWPDEAREFVAPKLPGDPPVIEGDHLPSQRGSSRQANVEASGSRPCVTGGSARQDVREAGQA